VKGAREYLVAMHLFCGQLILSTHTSFVAQHNNKSLPLTIRLVQFPQPRLWLDTCNY